MYHVDKVWKKKTKLVDVSLTGQTVIIDGSYSLKVFWSSHLYCCALQSHVTTQFWLHLKDVKTLELLKTSNTFSQTRCKTLNLSNLHVAVSLKIFRIVKCIARFKKNDNPFILIVATF